MSQAEAVLKRFKTSPQGTFGTLCVTFDGKDFSCFTGELPWKNNEPRRSCIPSGTYKCSMMHSPRFGRLMWELENVANRSDILLHIGNYCGDVAMGYQSDSAGCILLGYSHSMAPGKKQYGVWKSRETFDRFMRFTSGISEITLRVGGCGIPTTAEAHE